MTPLAQPARVDPTAAQRPPDRLSYDDRMAGMRAVVAAKKRYPGPAGEILAAEIQAYMDFSFRVSTASPVPQLIRELTTP